MESVEIHPGRERGPNDGSRRFMPAMFQFDTRAILLATVIDDGWEPEVKEQWRRNQASVREELVHQFGAEGYEQKIENFVDLGAAPWSVVALHNVYLRQIRVAFVGMNYYPALLGACGLGERILNQLVLTLREDFIGHEATRNVALKKSFDDWRVCIETLEAWDVFTSETAQSFKSLMKQRHAAVHYRSELDAGDARAAALQSVQLLCGVIEAIFAPIASRPYYFEGPIGRSFVRLASENEPFVKRFILPACVLIGPKFRFVPNGFDLKIHDDPDYGSDTPITDEEFVRLASDATGK